MQDSRNIPGPWLGEVCVLHPLGIQNIEDEYAKKHAKPYRMHVLPLLNHCDYNQLKHVHEPTFITILLGKEKPGVCESWL
jgi:hypothetical protein